MASDRDQLSLVTVAVDAEGGLPVVAARIASENQLPLPAVYVNDVVEVAGPMAGTVRVTVDPDVGAVKLPPLVFVGVETVTVGVVPKLLTMLP